MASAAYVDTYLGIWCWVNDTFTVARIRNYLQSGKGAQSSNAQTAKSDLLNGLQKLTGKALGQTFQVQGDTYITASISRVFMGKGAPDEIQDVIWLASLCKLVDTTTLSSYCDTKLGVDCGGFVANFWGMGHPLLTAAAVQGDMGISPRSFWNMNRGGRRKAASEIQVDDAAIFFEDVKGDNPDTVATKKEDGSFDTATGSQAFHIGLVSSVTQVAAPAPIAPNSKPAPVKITLEIAESSGGANSQSGGNGVRIRSLGTVPTTVANNLVYCLDGTNRIYFVGPPVVLPSYQPNPFTSA